MSNVSPFQSFSFTAPDDVFNTEVGNSEFMPVGDHEARIESAIFEVSEYGPQLKVKLVNDAGQVTTDYISLIAKNDESKQQTGVRPHYKYLLFGQSLISEPVARLTFLQKLVPSNPNAIDCVKNMRLKLRIDPPKSGYSIIDLNGRKIILDIASNEYVGDETYDSFDEAKNAAATMGLKRGFNKVTKYAPVNQETSDANLEILKPALAQFTQPARKPMARPGRI
jgi:hypothetical protein